MDETHRRCVIGIQPMFQGCTQVILWVFFLNANAVHSVSLALIELRTLSSTV